VGYFGSLGVYTVVLASSLATALWSVWLAEPGPRGPLSPIVLSVLAGAEMVAYLSVVLYLARGLTKTSKRVPDLRGIDPSAPTQRLLQPAAKQVVHDDDGLP
jgi:hypothetical protein